jgi:hypothetical protein
VNTDIPPATTSEEAPPHSPGHRCARLNCPNFAKFTYCSAECRVQQYNERRASAPNKCGICSSPNHRTEQCDSEAAKNLPALRDVVGPRRCRKCGGSDHDSRRCKKRRKKSVTAAPAKDA